MESILFDNVRFRYDIRDKYILDGVSGRILPGTVTFLLGNSGGGKSTFLKLAAGLLQPESGTVLFGSLDTLKASKPQLIEFHRQSAFSFQDSGLIYNINLFENLALPLRYHTGATDRELAERIDPVLAEFGLDDDRAHFPGQMSRSERKLAGIARCVIMDPELFFFDEPLAGLDYVATDRVKKILNRLAAAQKTLVITEQSLSLGMKIADRFFVLVDGKLVCDGDIDCLKASNDPFIRRLLDGRKETTSFYTALDQQPSSAQEPSHGV